MISADFNLNLGGFFGSIGKLTKGFSALAAPLAAVAGAAAVVGGAFAGMGKAISGAAAMESLEASFRTLIGNTEETQRVLESLTSFAASTPFEMPELGEASRALLAFGTTTEKLLPTLSAIGDIASGVQAPIGEIAEIFGKARVQGTLFAEDINQLTGRGIPVIQEFAKQLGVSESEVKKLGSEGKISFSNLEQAFQSLTAEGGKFHGQMKAQAGTWNGLMSTLRDNINMAFTKFGEPINDALKPMLESLLTYTAGFAQAAAEFGAQVGNAIAILQAAVGNGQLGEMIGLSLQAGFATAVNFLMASFRGLVAMLIVGIGSIPSTLLQGLMVIFDPGLWKGLDMVLAGIAQGFIATLASGLAPLIDRLVEMLNNIPGVDIPINTDDFANEMAKIASANFAGGSSKMGNALAPLGNEIKANLGAMTDEFNRAFQSTPDMLDASGPAGKLASLTSSLMSQVAAAKATKIDAPSVPNVEAAITSPIAKMVSSGLASIGLGGFTSSGSNPLMSEARKQTVVQERTMRAVEKLAAKDKSPQTAILKFA